MSAEIGDPDVIKDAVIVLETDGQVVHRFCSSAEGEEIMAANGKDGFNGSLFTTPGFKAELLFSVSNLQQRVEEAKLRLKRYSVIRQTLDKHGVPADPDVRKAIHKAIAELMVA